MPVNLTHSVLPEESGLSLDTLLRQTLRFSTRQAVDIKRSGSVTVNGEKRYGNQAVREGEIVFITLPEYDTPNLPEKAAPVEFLFLDEYVCAVRKETGLQTHPSPSCPGGSDTLELRVMSALGQAAHPVHRLDAETTGIVLFARYPYIQSVLQLDLTHGVIRKTYQAIVTGRLPHPYGVVDAPIRECEPGSFTRIVAPDGKAAVTEYRVLSESGPLSLVELSPKTGRTHQLRVHMTYLGCPLLGDARYKTPESQRISCELGVDHQQLCACRIQFVHPVTGREVTVEMPPDFSYAY